MMFWYFVIDLREMWVCNNTLHTIGSDIGDLKQLGFRGLWLQFGETSPGAMSAAASRGTDRAS